VFLEERANRTGNGHPLAPDGTRSEKPAGTDRCGRSRGLGAPASSHRSPSIPEVYPNPRRPAFAVGLRLGSKKTHPGTLVLPRRSPRPMRATQSAISGPFRPVQDRSGQFRPDRAGAGQAEEIALPGRPQNRTCRLTHPAGRCPRFVATTRRSDSSPRRAAFGFLSQRDRAAFVDSLACSSNTAFALAVYASRYAVARTPRKTRFRWTASPGRTGLESRRVSYAGSRHVVTILRARAVLGAITVAR